MTNDISNIFSKNLSDILYIQGKTQSELADFLKVSNTTVNNWIRGYNAPRMDKIDKICDYLDIERSQLLERDSNPTISKGKRVPVLGKVVAGIPIDAIEEVLDWEEISSDWQGEYFALKVTGDSMEPKMSEGDVVIVKKQNDVECGDTAIVLVNADEATVKKVIKSEEGITLVATNTNVFLPRFYSNKEVLELPIEIVGKVVELRAKF